MQPYPYPQPMQPPSLPFTSQQPQQSVEMRLAVLEAEKMETEIEKEEG